jgi:U3 small nucleolar RNA-associated protein 10
MATSLARQLQAIRSDVVATLDKRKHEKVGSLLFDSSEAAEQDYESVLSLGLNGLQGLIQIDPRFKPFEDTLFSKTSFQIDRALLVTFLHS